YQPSVPQEISAGVSAPLACRTTARWTRSRTLRRSVSSQRDSRSSSAAKLSGAKKRRAQAGTPRAASPMAPSPPGGPSPIVPSGSLDETVEGGACDGVPCDGWGAFWSQVIVSGRRVTTAEAPSCAACAWGSTSSSHQTAALLAPKPSATALQNKLASTSALRPRRGGGRTVDALGRRERGMAVLESGGGGGAAGSRDPEDSPAGVAGAGGSTVALAAPVGRACVEGGGGGRRMCRRRAGDGKAAPAARPAPRNRTGVGRPSLATGRPMDHSEPRCGASPCCPAPAADIHPSHAG